MPHSCRHDFNLTLIFEHADTQFRSALYGADHRCFASALFVCVLQKKQTFNVTGLPCGTNERFQTASFVDFTSRCKSRTIRL